MHPQLRTYQKYSIKLNIYHNCAQQLHEDLQYLLRLQGQYKYKNKSYDMF